MKPEIRDFVMWTYVATAVMVTLGLSICMGFKHGYGALALTVVVSTGGFCGLAPAVAKLLERK